MKKLIAVVAVAALMSPVVAMAATPTHTHTQFNRLLAQAISKIPPHHPRPFVMQSRTRW